MKILTDGIVEGVVLWQKLMKAMMGLGHWYLGDRHRGMDLLKMLVGSNSKTQTIEENVLYDQVFKLKTHYAFNIPAA